MVDMTVYNCNLLYFFFRLQAFTGIIKVRKHRTVIKLLFDRLIK